MPFEKGEGGKKVFYLVGGGPSGLRLSRPGKRRGSLARDSGFTGRKKVEDNLTSSGPRKTFLGGSQ